MAQRKDQHAWTEKEDAFLMAKKAEGASAKSIDYGLRAKFGHGRSTQSINTRMSHLRRVGKAPPVDRTKPHPGRRPEDNGPKPDLKKDPDKKETPVIYDGSDMEYCGLINDLSIYDGKAVTGLLEHLRRREDFICSRLKEQADRIVTYDSTKDLVTLTGAEAQSLDEERKKLYVKMVMGELPPRDFDSIELLAIPGHGSTRNRVSLILPLYKENVDMKGEGRELQKLLYVATTSLLLHGDLFTIVKNPKNEFRDLVRLDLNSETYDPQVYDSVSKNIEKEITRSSSEEFKVKIFEDLLSGYNLYGGK